MTHQFRSFPTISRSRRPNARHALLAACALVPVVAISCSDADSSSIATSDADLSASTDAAPDSPEASPINTAIHLSMRDGVRIAVDVWLPGNTSRGDGVPSIVLGTRYWRDFDVSNREAMPETDREATAKSFVSAGYAYVTIDARGTGASFGLAKQPWSPDEIADYGEVLAWIVKQPWSNGRVGTYGVSYESNTAELMATISDVGVQAVIPRFGYPNVYTDVIFPGGIFNREFMHAWLDRSRVMDANDICSLVGVSGTDCESLLSVQTGVKPVDADQGRALLSAAVAEHATAPDEFAVVSTLTSSDDPWDGVSFASISPGLEGDGIEHREPAFMAWASWMDLGTAQGALNRWATTDTPMVVYLGPWNHDASTDANPYLDRDAPLEMAGAEQRALEIQFFDRYLKPSSVPPSRQIVYFTLGENVWKETAEWPPAGTQVTPVYFREQGELSFAAPSSAERPDGYEVDFSATTGTANGWWTKFTGADVYQGDRRAEDDKLLVYTSAPLESDLEITGHPQVTVYLSSTESDGAVFAYLEDVAPNGTVTGITEGELRLIHRKPCAEPDTFNVYGPCHSFRSEDTLPMPPGELQEVTIGLHPTSVLLRAGHSIRVALAGHDASTFARTPSSGAPVWSVAHDPEHPSRIALPVASRLE
jgi:putative CocE/NonD family hydrolase